MKLWSEPWVVNLAANVLPTERVSLSILSPTPKKGIKSRAQQKTLLPEPTSSFWYTSVSLTTF